MTRADTTHASGTFSPGNTIAPVPQAKSLHPTNLAHLRRYRPIVNSLLTLKTLFIHKLTLLTRGACPSQYHPKSSQGTHCHALKKKFPWLVNNTLPLPQEIDNHQRIYSQMGCSRSIINSHTSQTIYFGIKLRISTQSNKRKRKFHIFFRGECCGRSGPRVPTGELKLHINIHFQYMAGPLILIDN